MLCTYFYFFYKYSLDEFIYNQKGCDIVYAFIRMSRFLLTLLRAIYTTTIFNRNRNFQRQPRPNFPCMGSSNRNHNRNLQVAVDVDQNFLIRIWWTELKVAVEVAVVHGQKRSNMLHKNRYLHAFELVY